MDDKRLPDSNDDLDELLDSALSDFQSLKVSSSNQRTEREQDEIKSEESHPASIPPKIHGLGKGMGLPDMRSRNKGSTPKEKRKSNEESHVAEALEKLREQTRNTVRGLESTKSENLDPDAMMEDWVKQFEELAGSQGMESMVETMMQQLLSKEILHEPMKEIGDRYPKWLEENESKIGKEEYERYVRQYNLIRSLNDVYETDPSNFTVIVDLMQQMQECGQPPSDIVKEIAPDVDLAALGQLSPEMVGNQPNCCVM